MCGCDGGGGSTSSMSVEPTIIIQAGSVTQTGSITVNWIAPVARVDGPPLSLAEIDGYRIHYGKFSGN